MKCFHNHYIRACDGGGGGGVGARNVSRLNMDPIVTTQSHISLRKRLGISLYICGKINLYETRSRTTNLDPDHLYISYFPSFGFQGEALADVHLAFHKGTPGLETATRRCRSTPHITTVILGKLKTRNLWLSMPKRNCRIRILKTTPQPIINPWQGQPRALQRRHPRHAQVRQLQVSRTPPRKRLKTARTQRSRKLFRQGNPFQLPSWVRGE